MKIAAEIASAFFDGLGLVLGHLLRALFRLLYVNDGSLMDAIILVLGLMTVLLVVVIVRRWLRSLRIRSDRRLAARQKHRGGALQRAAPRRLFNVSLGKRRG